MIIGFIARLHHHPVEVNAVTTTHSAVFIKVDPTGEISTGDRSDTLSQGEFPPDVRLVEGHSFRKPRQRVSGT
jgi:hypothetical protein